MKKYGLLGLKSLFMAMIIALTLGSTVLAQTATPEDLGIVVPYSAPYYLPHRFEQVVVTETLRIRADHNTQSTQNGNLNMNTTVTVLDLWWSGNAGEENRALWFLHEGGWSQAMSETGVWYIMATGSGEFPAPAPTVATVRDITDAPVILHTTEPATYFFSVGIEGEDDPILVFIPVGYIATCDVPDTENGQVEIVVGGENVSRLAFACTIRYFASFDWQDAVNELPGACNLLWAEQANAANSLNEDFVVYALYQNDCPPQQLGVGGGGDIGECPAFISVNNSTAQTMPLDDGTGGCVWHYSATVGTVNIRLQPGEAVVWWDGSATQSYTNERTTEYTMQAEGDFTWYPATQPEATEAAPLGG